MSFGDGAAASQSAQRKTRLSTVDRPIRRSALTIEHGRDIFRFDTFGDEEFWGDALKLHEARGRISGASARA